MDMSPTLYELVACAGDEDRPIWFYADRYAVDRLGTELARLIRWDDQADGEDRLCGTLTGADRSTTLRYEPPSEPGNDSLHAQVPCPDRAGCPGPAWDRITSRGELLMALETGEVDDPWCEGSHR